MQTVMKRPTTKKLISFDTPSQVERIQRAAKLKHWTFTRFVIEAAVAAATQTLMVKENGSKPLMAESNPLALNQ